MSTFPSFFNSYKAKYRYTELRSKLRSKIQVNYTSPNGFRPGTLFRKIIWTRFFAPLSPGPLSGTYGPWPLSKGSPKALQTPCA